MGVSDKFLEFSKILWEKLFAKPLAIDQGVGYYLFYYEKLFKDYIIISDNYGPVMTIGLTKREYIKLDEKNNILNFKGEIAHVVHQYDRKVDIMIKIIAKYCPELYGTIKPIISYLNSTEKNIFNKTFQENLIIVKTFYTHIKVALCTMGKKENLYAKEFMEYYMNLGVNHIFIYDNNDPFTERIKDVLDKKYKERITFYETQSFNIIDQTQAFTNCYENNLKKFDWFIMVDMDEYLFIVNDTLKNYLNNKIFGKCDFIKIHRVDTQDNDLLYYDSRTLFKRFKKPYIKTKFIKTIIRGNIPDLKYWVHSPYISPIKNITCTNGGRLINYKNMNFETILPINTNKSYLIHFRFKSTEEFINKYRRGYSNWHGNQTLNVLFSI